MKKSGSPVTESSRLVRKMRSLFLLPFVRAKSDFLRTLYWDFRAKEIHRTWGEGRDDYAVLGDVIDLVRPSKLLDIGCGSGRCFPLYLEKGVPEVVGQDISARALELCSHRFTVPCIRLFLGPLSTLPYGTDHFDLIVSTRVLSAVLPEKIGPLMASLSGVGRAVYINEMTESDYLGPSRDWFLHDYDLLFLNNKFLKVKEGTISVTEKGKTHIQTWRLYAKGEICPL
jgi:SAM-dependent methyltransferase